MHQVAAQKIRIFPAACSTPTNGVFLRIVALQALNTPFAVFTCPLFFAISAVNTE